MGIGHSKTVGISDPTQGELDARIALGQYPSGTVLADIALGSDWNADHVFSGGTAGSVLFLGGSGAILQDNAGLYFDTTNKYLGVGTASPGLPIQVGANAVGTPDGAVYVSRTITGAGNGHGFGDETNFNTSGGASSYNAFDCRTTVTGIGTAAGAHMAGFQFRPTLAFSTTLPEVRGYHFTASTTLTGGGTVTDMSAFLVGGPTVTSGAVTNFYAFKADAVGAGVTNAWGVYVASTYDNFMGGILGLGTTAPAARLHLGGNLTKPAWTTSGICLRLAAATYTDSSSSGTVAACYANALATPTFAASSVTTYTTGANVFIGNEPTAGTNVTITNAFSLIVSQKARFSSYVGIGSTVTPTSCLQIGTNQTAASWTTQGLLFHIGAQTLTDSTGSGTIATRVSSSVGTPTFASSSAVTVTNGASLYIAGAPANGTNTTITNPWAIWVDAGDCRFDGNLAIGVTTTPHSSVQVAGSLALQVTSTSTNLTLTSAHYIVRVDASGANRTITLPAASGCTGRVYVIKKTDSSANSVTIDGNGAETIDGATTVVLASQYEVTMIQSNGTGWDMVV